MESLKNLGWIFLVAGLAATISASVIYAEHLSSDTSLSTPQDNLRFQEALLQKIQNDMLETKYWSNAQHLSYNEAQVKKYLEAGWASDHRMRIYEWQHLTSMVLFSLMIFMFLFGLYLTYRHFLLSEKILQDFGHEGRRGEQGVAPAVHELSFDAGSASVKTQAVGVVILVITMTMFYLYLEGVYPIKEETVPARVEWQPVSAANHQVAEK